jgi:hypothetical protein
MLPLRPHAATCAPLLHSPVVEQQPEGQVSGPHVPPSVPPLPPPEPLRHEPLEHVWPCGQAKQVTASEPHTLSTVPS